MAEVAPTEPAPLSVPGDLLSGDSRFGGVFGLTELGPLADLVEPSLGMAPVAHDDDVMTSIDAIDAVDAELPRSSRKRAGLCPSSRPACATDCAARPTRPRLPPRCAPCTRSGRARGWPARCAWAMCHRLESRIERLLANPPAQAADLEALQTRGDALLAAFEPCGRATRRPMPRLRPLRCAPSSRWWRRPRRCLRSRRRAGACCRAETVPPKPPRQAKPEPALVARPPRNCPTSTGRGSAPRHRSRRSPTGPRLQLPPRRPCACARRCSTTWSARPAR